MNATNLTAKIMKIPLFFFFSLLLALITVFILQPASYLAIQPCASFPEA